MDRYVWVWVCQFVYALMLMCVLRRCWLLLHSSAFTKTKTGIACTSTVYKRVHMFMYMYTDMDISVSFSFFHNTWTLHYTLLLLCSSDCMCIGALSIEYIVQNVCMCVCVYTHCVWLKPLLACWYCCCHCRDIVLLEKRKKFDFRCEQNWFYSSFYITIYVYYTNMYAAITASNMNGTLIFLPKNQNNNYINIRTDRQIDR